MLNSLKKLQLLYAYPNCVQIGDRMQGSENEIIILDLTVTDPKRFNFMADYRRLNVLMSRARSSLIIVAGAQVLLGPQWWRVQGYEQRQPNALTELSRVFPVENAIGKLPTHVLNFRAMANSAIDSGYPIHVVQTQFLELRCPRHPEGHFRISAPNRALYWYRCYNKRQQAVDSGEGMFIPRCKNLCGVMCVRGLHPCTQVCHVHAPWFHEYHLPEYTCYQLRDVHLSEFGCSHDTVVERPCYVKLEEQLQKLLKDQKLGMNWPCQGEEVRCCQRCGHQQYCP